MLVEKKLYKLTYSVVAKPEVWEGFEVASEEYISASNYKEAKETAKLRIKKVAFEHMQTGNVEKIDLVLFSDKVTFDNNPLI